MKKSGNLLGKGVETSTFISDGFICTLLSSVCPNLAKKLWFFWCNMYLAFHDSFKLHFFTISKRCLHKILFSVLKKGAPISNAFWIRSLHTQKNRMFLKMAMGYSRIESFFALIKILHT